MKTLVVLIVLALVSPALLAAGTQTGTPSDTSVGTTSTAPTTTGATTTQQPTTSKKVSRAKNANARKECLKENPGLKGKELKDCISKKASS